MYLLFLSLHTIGDNSTPSDHSAHWKIHKRIKSRTTAPFLADFSTEHKNGVTLSNTTASPRSPTGFNLQKRKRKKSANSICWWVPPHTSTSYSQGRVGWLDKIVKIAFLRESFLFKKITREVQGDSLRAIPTSNWLEIMHHWEGNTDTPP